MLGWGRRVKRRKQIILRKKTPSTPAHPPKTHCTAFKFHLFARWLRPCFVSTWTFRRICLTMPTWCKLQSSSRGIQGWCLPGACPRCGSAPRSPPHICNRGTRQHTEPLHIFYIWQLLVWHSRKLTINWNLAVPDKVNLVPDNNDSLCVEMTGLPEGLKQGFSLSESARVSDAEDNEDTVALWPSAALPASLLVLLITLRNTSTSNLLSTCASSELMSRKTSSVSRSSSMMQTLGSGTDALLDS